MKLQNNKTQINLFYLLNLQHVMIYKQPSFAVHKFSLHLEGKKVRTHMLYPKNLTAVIHCDRLTISFWSIAYHFIDHTTDKTYKHRFGIS